MNIGIRVLIAFMLGVASYPLAFDFIALMQHELAHSEEIHKTPYSSPVEP